MNKLASGLLLSFGKEKMRSSSLTKNGDTKSQGRSASIFRIYTS